MKVTLFGNGDFVGIIKYDWCPYKRGEGSQTCGEDGHVTSLGAGGGWGGRDWSHASTSQDAKDFGEPQGL